MIAEPVLISILLRDNMHILLVVVYKRSKVKVDYEMLI